MLLSLVEKVKFKAAVDSLKSALSATPIEKPQPNDEPIVNVAAALSEAAAPSPLPNENLGNNTETNMPAEPSLANDIRSVIEQQQLGENVHLEISPSKIRVQIRGSALFESGEEILIDDAIPIFDSIVTLMEKHENYRINIKGFTDNVPIATYRFPSNWELSAVRATTVLRFFVDRGIAAQRMTATGYGSLFPVVPNTTAENRSKNRRVEFVLEKTETED